MSKSSLVFSEDSYKIPKKFFIYDDVVIHNTPEDFWVVVNDIVMDLTPLIFDRKCSMNNNLRYLLAFGGKNLSCYFDECGLPLTEVSGTTGQRRVLFGPVVETAESEMCKTPGLFWWEDPFYIKGRLTKQERRIRIINTLTGHTHTLNVCEEDSIYDIQAKYKRLYNSHAGSYIWRKDYRNGKVSGRLCLDKTLTANGIFLEKADPPPSLWLFYNDDFTIA